MSDLPRVAVIGAGAVGSYFGGMLARAGHRVTFVGRPGSTSRHLQLVRERGLVIDGVEIQETIKIAVADTAAALADARLVLFSVKTVDTESAAESIRPHLAADATVVSLQNGADNVDRMRAVGVDAIAAVVIVAAAIDTPGTIRHRGRGDLIIGDPERPEEARRVAAIFERAGVPCRVSDRIRQDLWVKLILNSMANAVSALTRASYGRLREFEPTWRIALDVGREGVAVARADGIELDLDELLAQGNAIIKGVGNATSSTEQDIAHGRRTEIDSLNGFIARRGAALGIATPTNEVLWALVKLREEQARAGS
jgi:2-dehydropantoate 2-reductase